MRVAIKPELLRWARERAGMEVADLVSQFKRLPEWESGKAQPTLRQVEAFARKVHAPIGCLFLSAPPEERIPIPDFRSFAGRDVTRPSPDLLDTIYICQERQGWYRDFALSNGEGDLDFVDSATLQIAPAIVAARMRERLGFNTAARRECATWEDALRLLVRQAEDIGVLVMISGVVLNNNKRPLNTKEFRGFALSDTLAPLVFINGKDSKSAQMFTLAHELAHLWLGESALLNIGIAPRSGCRKAEVWCNAVASEFLVPMEELRAELREEPFADALPRLAELFKVSTLVIMRRLLDAKWLSRRVFNSEWEREVNRLQSINVHRSSGEGNFYRTALDRVSRRFAHALTVSTLEGQTLYRDAFRMLGISKTKTFDKISYEVGVTG